MIDRLETGGAEKILVHLTRLLVASGVETGVLLFAAGSPLGHELDKRLQVHLLNRKNKFNPFNLFKAHRLCSRYNIVHTHLRHVHAYIRLAQLLFNGKYKVMLHDHASPTAGIPARLKGFFKPRYYIGVNQDQIAWAENSVGIDRKNIFLLENTVAAQPAGTAIILKTLRAIMVANIRRVKNIEFAIALCRKMDWQLDIYGNVIEPDYHSELLTLAGNDGSVNIKTGITDFSATYPQYRLAIHCSPQETGPLVLIEYLAAGLPFIAYKTGSAAETIAVELPQLFMNNFDHEEWVQRIPEI
ncbi:MAG TPA: glycosyltransferase, partial [Chitinophagaceae bacterium]|nr:glycosyltransferase [Chitinophagaceae bacterium]